MQKNLKAFVLLVALAGAWAGAPAAAQTPAPAPPAPAVQETQEPAAPPASAGPASAGSGLPAQVTVKLEGDSKGGISIELVIAILAGLVAVLTTFMSSRNATKIEELRAQYEFQRTSLREEAEKEVRNAIEQHEERMQLLGHSLQAQRDEIARQHEARIVEVSNQHQVSRDRAAEMLEQERLEQLKFSDNYDIALAAARLEQERDIAIMAMLEKYHEQLLSHDPKVREPALRLLSIFVPDEILDRFQPRQFVASLG